MKSEDQPTEASAGDSRAFPWWDVRRPGMYQAYVVLFWASTPIALTHLRDLISQNMSIGVMSAGLVWLLAHLAIMSMAIKLRLIEPIWPRVLFVVAVITATAGAIGITALIVTPEAVMMHGRNLLSTLPGLLLGAMALLSLSARRSGSRAPTSHP
jgi:hypothetical protein